MMDGFQSIFKSTIIVLFLLVWVCGIALQKDVFADTRTHTFELHSTLASRIEQAFIKCYSISVEPKKKIEALELFLIAETLSELNQPYRADQYRHYLLTYFSHHILAELVQLKGDQTMPIELYESDPSFSRLVKQSFLYARTHQDNLEENFYHSFALVLKITLAHALGEDTADLRQVVYDVYPESSFTGWLAYQKSWQLFLEHQGSTEAFYDFWRANKKSPLGQESFEAIDAGWFPPRKIGLTSALLPGLGEELLEPGMREAAGQTYYELLYLAGTVGFAIAAQQQNRIQNLTGALIFGNFLLLNHRGSSERAYVLAMRRNSAAYRAFQIERMDRSFFGKGHYKMPLEPEPQVVIRHGLHLGLTYGLNSVADGLRDTVVRNDTLHNMGMDLSYHLSLWQMWVTDRMILSIDVLPRGNVIINQVQVEDAYKDRLGESIAATEIWASGECGLKAAFALSENSILQFTSTIGPAYYMESLEYDGYQKQALGLAGAFSLDLLGLSGNSWNLGVLWHHRMEETVLDIEGQRKSLPDIAMQLRFGIGIRF